MTSINSNHVLQHNHIARAYELDCLQRYDLALQAVQRALDLSPNSAEAHACGAWVLKQSGRLDDAEEAVQHALSFDPLYAPAHNVKACILWRQGRMLEAEHSFDSAIALQTSDTPLFIANYASMQLTRRRPQDALELVNRALALAPTSVRAYVIRGEALRQLGEHKAATEAFRTALRFDPRNASAYNNLGLVQLAQGQVHDAQDSFREALRLQPGEAQAQANLVLALRAQYPLYGRLLAFMMRAKTARGRRYFVWASVIALTLLALLPVILGLAYGVQTGSMPPDEQNLILLLAFSVFAVWLLAVAGSLILRPVFNLLLRLDARNRAVVRFEPADVLGAGLLFMALFSLLVYGVLLVTSGPFVTASLAALQAGVAGLLSILLSNGVRRLDQDTAFRRWVSWASYAVLTGSLYAIAVGLALNIISNMSWVLWLFSGSLFVYGVLWILRGMDVLKVPAGARRSLMQWLLGIAGIAAITAITAMGLGMELSWAVLTGAFMASVGSVVTTHRTVRDARLYRQWVTRYGEVSAQNRTVLLFMSACVLLAAIFLVLRYLIAG